MGNLDTAGTLTLSGASIPAGTTVQTNLGTFNAYSDTASGTYFDPGQTVMVSASGGTVPAFGPQALTSPGLLSTTVPAWGASGQGAVPQSLLAQMVGTGWSVGFAQQATTTFTAGSYVVTETAIVESGNRPIP
jgi:hypothetical protein